MTINDDIKDPENPVTLSTDLAALLLKILPKQASMLMASGSITKGQINTMLTLAINLSQDSNDIDRLVAGLIQYL